jgi:hypothetical protein
VQRRLINSGICGLRSRECSIHSSSTMGCKLCWRSRGFLILRAEFDSLAAHQLSMLYSSHVWIEG